MAHNTGLTHWLLRHAKLVLGLIALVGLLGVWFSWLLWQLLSSKEHQVVAEQQRSAATLLVERVQEDLEEQLRSFARFGRRIESLEQFDAHSWQHESHVQLEDFSSWHVLVLIDRQYRLRHVFTRAGDLPLEQAHYQQVLRRFSGLAEQAREQRRDAMTPPHLTRHKRLGQGHLVPLYDPQGAFIGWLYGGFFVGELMARALIPMIEQGYVIRLLQGEQVIFDNDPERRLGNSQGVATHSPLYLRDTRYDIWLEPSEALVSAGFTDWPQWVLLASLLNTALLMLALFYNYRRLQAEQAVRQSKLLVQELLALTGQAADALLVVKPEGRQVLYASPRLLELTGHANEAAIQRLLKERPSALTPNPERWQADFAPGKTHEFRAQLAHTNGSLRTVDVSARGVLFHRERFVLYSCRDASQRMAVEQALKEQSLLDGLTGLHNRRAFDQAIARAIDGLQAGASCTLVMLDVDYFKRFNDSLGHQAGDDCLRELGQLLSDNTRRDSEQAFRYGGEEFALLLEGDSNAAGKAAEHIRLALQQRAISHPQSPLGVVTISLGLAVGRAQQSAEAWLKAADQALYQAKQQGRNCVVKADA